MTENHETAFARWQQAHPETRTAAGIAAKLGVKRQCVDHWLNGRSEPKLRVLVQLLELTGLAPADFLVSDDIKALRRKVRA